MKKKLFRAFFFLILFSSVACTAPLYVECQDAYPDEWLDLFGIPQNSLNFKTISITGPADFSFSDFIPTGHIFHDPEGFSLQAFTLERLSSVTLRC